ncbi:MAG TPA: hypothetical protein VJ924_14160 [Alphaproteobacteria bacterium]|nr:hypothetical protein [Alphaproteobacteria bacterium]
MTSIADSVRRDTEGAAEPARRLAMDSLEVPAEMRLIDKADIGGDRGDGLAPRQHRGRPLDADSDQHRMRRYAKLPSEGANDLKWRALRQRRKIREADPIGEVVEHVIERASHRTG